MWKEICPDLIRFLMYIAFCIPMYILISIILLGRTFNCSSSLPERAESTWFRNAKGIGMILCTEAALKSCCPISSALLFVPLFSFYFLSMSPSNSIWIMKRLWLFYHFRSPKENNLKWRVPSLCWIASVFWMNSQISS